MSAARTRSPLREVKCDDCCCRDTTGTGRVVRVIGPVVDAEFPRDAMPEMFNALHVDVTLAGGTRR